MVLKTKTMKVRTLIQNNGDMLKTEGLITDWTLILKIYIVYWEKVETCWKKHNKIKRKKGKTNELKKS